MAAPTGDLRQPTIGVCFMCLRPPEDHRPGDRCDFAKHPLVPAPPRGGVGHSGNLRIKSDGLVAEAFKRRPLLDGSGPEQADVLREWPSLCQAPPPPIVTEGPA